MLLFSCAVSVENTDLLASVTTSASVRSITSTEGKITLLLCSQLSISALLQIVGGDKLIIPFADGAAHEPIQRPAFSA
jgi:hypothetical protein